MSAGFFVIGGTLRSDAPSYVHRNADDELYEGLSRGDFCYVLTSRQMGKSSLMLRTALRLRGDGVAVAVLDLTALGQNLTAEQWYDGLLSSIGMQLNVEAELEAFWMAQERLGPMKRCLEAIRAVVLTRHAGPVVIFIDEIDAVRSLPFSSDEFFAGIREFYNRRTEADNLRRLTFCLLGVATPSDLIRDTRVTPFNIGRRIELNDFSESEALPLADGLGRETAVGGRLLKQILHWTGGHPYLTQRLCHAVADCADVTDSRGVDSLCSDLFFSQRARERDDNLLFVRERLLRSEVDLAGLLDLYAKVRRRQSIADDETNPLVGVLRLSGVIRVVDGYLRVRSRIYDRVFDREWVRSNMPDAERRRQAAAYRRGLVRAGAFAAVIVAAVGSLAIYAASARARADENLLRAHTSAAEAQRASEDSEAERVKAEEHMAEAESQRQEAIRQRSVADEQRLRAEAEERSGRRVLYAAQMHLAVQDWDAGNVVHLRSVLSAQIPKPGKEDLRGFEWHYLWRLFDNFNFTLHLPTGLTGPKLVVSPDGTQFAEDDMAGTVRLRDLGSGRQIGLISYPGRLSFEELRTRLLSRPRRSDRLIPITLAYSGDGKQLVVTGDGGTATVWEVASYTRRATLSLGFGVSQVGFSPDGRRVLALGLDTVRVFDILTASEVRSIHEAGWTPLASRLSPDGNNLLIVDQTKMTVWEIESGRKLSETDIKLSAASSLMALSPDFTMSISSSENVLSLVNRLTGEVLWTRPYQGPSWSIDPTMGWFNSSFVEFSADGTRVAVSEGNVVTVLDSRTGSVLATVKELYDIGSVTFVPDATGILVTSGATIRSWPVQSAFSVMSRLGRYNYLGGMVAAFSADGTTALVAGRQGLMEELDVVAGRIKKEYVVAKSSDIWSSLPSMVAVTPSLVVEAERRTLKRWDRATSRELPPLEIPGSRAIRNLAVSADGRIAAISTDFRKELNLGGRITSVSVASPIEIWDLQVQERRQILDVEPFGKFSFSTDGQKLAVVASDGGIQIWNVSTGRKPVRLQGSTSNSTPVLSPDGALAVATLEGTPTIWDALTGRQTLALEGHAGGVKAFTFSPDGMRVATAGGDGTVRIWDSVSGQELLTLRHAAVGSDVSATGVSFSPDGRRLVTVASDGSVKLWRTVLDRESPSPKTVGKRP